MAAVDEKPFLFFPFGVKGTWLWWGNDFFTPSSKSRSHQVPFLFLSLRQQLEENEKIVGDSRKIDSFEKNALCNTLFFLEKVGISILRFLLKLECPFL